MGMRIAFLLSCAVVASDHASGQSVPKPRSAIRIATFNASLNRETSGKLVRDLTDPSNPQARNVAEIIQRVRPDILLINEFDYDMEGKAAELFRRNYLGIGQKGAVPIQYPHHFVAEVNTGVPSGADLDGDGKVVKVEGSRGYGNDAIGFGQFTGQYGMVVYSMFPLKRDEVRKFGRLLWKDMPGALLPTKADGSPWYSAEALNVLRLSSKNHWDVPVTVNGRVLHLLASHPTPPAFDGPEDRNGKRNHDEIRLWADFLTGGVKAEYLRKALAPDASIAPPESFVLLGDQNADPLDGGGISGAIQQLLDHPKVNSTFVPESVGAVEANRQQKEENTKHRGDPAADTADFGDDVVGNLRVDYILPSRNLKVLAGGVFWPSPIDPLGRLVEMSPVASSDHRLVYLDVEGP